jgi:uncharacterized protein
VNDAAALVHRQASQRDVPERLKALEHDVEHAAHLLPTQAPIRVFVHHNTLHAFEDRTFDEALLVGASTFGCHAYLTEDRYRQELARGRIQYQDLFAVLLDDMGDEADRLVGSLGTLFHIRMAMLEHPLRFGTETELRWLMAETDALRKFRTETRPDLRERMIADTRRWVMRDLRRAASGRDKSIQYATAALFERFDEAMIEQWSPATWEAVTLTLLWSVCHAGVHGVRRFAPPITPPVRQRDLLFAATGVDTDRLVNDALIPFCGAFLDQGIAHWTLPNREQGFLRAWLDLNRGNRPVDRWMRQLPTEIKRIDTLGLGPLEIIDESLRDLGISDNQREEFLSRTLLALGGWAGMIWQTETNAEWIVRPSPPGTLIDYLAVRLLLERLALASVARESLDFTGPLSELRAVLHAKIAHAPRVRVDQRAYVVFQLAQVLGWKPEELHRQSKSEWSRLVQEIETFSSIQRRRVYHLAFERRYRTQALDAILAHGPRAGEIVETPDFQVVCCLDEREESFRRHLEEVAPRCETFSVAGFYGVAMYYRGVAEAHYVPLCPIVIKPKHYVQEEVAYSYAETHRRRSETRRAIGKTSHWLHALSRSVIGGALTALFGSVASIPLVARVLFPRLTARIRRSLASFVQPPPLTRQSIERLEPTPGPDNGNLGFSIDEMASIGARVLQDIGLTTRFARLVVLTGHGSSSLNNPHESAYDCGACGGGRGGPNARALAAMLSDPRVRERLQEIGLVIPKETIFIGAYHNTCEDSVDYYDLDRLPYSHRDDFELARRALEETRRRNAHERCRRFESAELALSEEGALRHVQGRAEDLSQVRPECGHATNAICFVGRRSRTKGLYLDRRTFLTSYDPTQDDERGTVLERILQAVIPVCAGINLEYFFCYVDNKGYGCGTKLPHNITALLGVMDGAASDLRSGLPWQMVEIHEPVRILFVLESTTDIVLGVLERNPALSQLVHNCWVQLAVLDPRQAQIQIFREHRFEPYEPESSTLPVVKSSLDWYRGWRDHLGFASIVADGQPAAERARGAER